MTTCLGDGWPVMLSISDNPKRKLRHTWEMVHNGCCWIGINTHLANRVAEEAVANHVIAELRGYDGVRREVRYGENSRVDLLLEGGDGICYVEVKNVTLVDGEGRYAFPDAVTSRGLKHLGELATMVRGGHRAVMLYVVQRSDGGAFTTAADIDPAYAEGLRRAVDGGVEVLAYRAEVSPEAVEIVERLTIEL
jgi:sugar fermentation stimulation protein A